MEALTKTFVRPPLCASASLTGLPSVAVKSSARGGSSSSFPSVSKAATSAANRTVRTFALPNDDDVIALNSGKSLEELEETIRRIAEENEQLRARAAAAAANARRAESAFKGDVDVSRPRMGAVPPPPPPEFAAAPVVEYLDTTLGGVPTEEVASVEAKYLVEEAGSVRSWQEAVEQEAATSAAADGNLEIAAAGGIEDIQKTENPMSIVFVASEVAPCSNTGGLADAVGSLPVVHSLPHITACLPPSHPSSLHQHCVRGVRGGPLLQNRRPGGRGGVAASAPCPLISPFPLCSLHPSPLFPPSTTTSIVFVASEVAPYSKTGGLADVVGSLPVALAARGHRVMVVAPRYMNGVTDKLYAGAFDMQVGREGELAARGHRVMVVAPRYMDGVTDKLYAGAFDMQCRIKCFCFEGAHEVAFFHEFRDGVDFVFVDHPSYHRPGTPYGDQNGTFGDNQFRFTLLCHAACEAPLQLELGGFTYGEKVLFIANDWHAGLLPVLVASNYRPHGVYKDARTILAIHNLSHQGVEPGYTFGSLGVPGDWYGALEWVFPEWARKHELDKGEAVNILKGAIVTADRIVTVSPVCKHELDKGEAVNILKGAIVTADRIVTVSPHELDKGEAVNILEWAIAVRIVTVSSGYAWEMATVKGGWVGSHAHGYAWEIATVEGGWGPHLLANSTTHLRPSPLFPSSLPLHTLQGYAWEITTVEGGWGLDGLLRGRSFVLNGRKLHIRLKSHLITMAHELAWGTFSPLIAEKTPPRSLPSPCLPPLSVCMHTPPSSPLPPVPATYGVTNGVDVVDGNPACHGQACSVTNGVDMVDGNPACHGQACSVTNGVDVVDGNPACHGQACSVTNGVDVVDWNPATDKHIPSQYTAADMAGKAACKAALQQELGLPVRPDVPLIGFIGRLDWQKGPDVIQAGVPELMTDDVQFIMLGSGDAEYESWMAWAEGEYRDKFRGWVGFSVPVAHRMTAGCDILLMPSRFEPCGLNQLYAMRYGTIPVVHATGGLRDFDPLVLFSSATLPSPISRHLPPPPSYPPTPSPPTNPPQPHTSPFPTPHLPLFSHPLQDTVQDFNPFANEGKDDDTRRCQRHGSGLQPVCQRGQGRWYRVSRGGKGGDTERVSGGVGAG
ncbi:unnamed protein product [Closterium sp. NIES-65]|nr:unnamed protein product [Closterium sp. NIES-65]